MSEIQSRVNLQQLFARYDLVRIPMIQRDYAQGRPSAAQIREEFLSGIEKSLRLPAGDPSLPMNLDFIYGTLRETSGTSLFEPLDGQQRLTTLFLLHWYLAWTEKRLSDFSAIFGADEHSRFSYQVRQSSAEFYDSLVRFLPHDGPEDVKNLSSYISNQPWFFRSWRLDPTIQSVLVMLDSIHERFRDTDNLFARLLDEESPPITFQLLDLKNFGLSDDLYIKMNARGVPLTPFETFKARYEQDLTKQFAGATRAIGDHEFPIHEFVARRLDTAWLDIFWTERHETGSIVDESMFELFRIVALITRNPDADQCPDDVATLINERPNYAAFQENGWLDPEFTETLIPLLECWSSNTGGFKPLLPNTKYFDERSAFNRFTDGSAISAVTDVLLFMAYALFIREHENNLDIARMTEWLRVVHNLIINSNIDRVDRVPAGMTIIRALLPFANEILQHLQSGIAPSAFATNVKHQLEEETLKAQLLLGHHGWANWIERAELHSYFRGQIDFLLDFSGVKGEAASDPVSNWNESKHQTQQQEFETMLRKAEAMFDVKGLNESHDFLWSRALLIIGDYLLESNRNKSLLINSSTEQVSWKRLLRGFTETERAGRDYIRLLWSRLDNKKPYEPQLRRIISDEKKMADPWRVAIATTPQVWSYGSSRMLRFADDNIYLLRRSQMNGAHAELFGFCFFETDLKQLQTSGQLEPLQISHYEEVSSSEVEPYFALSYRDSFVEVDYVGERYRIGVLSEQLRKDKRLKQALHEAGTLEPLDRYECISVTARKLKSTLTSIATRLR